MLEQQLARSVLMIRPAAFGANAQTWPSNHFQVFSQTDEGLVEQAQREFDALVIALWNAGVNVVVIDDSPEPLRPDAVFPNNWLTTHADGTAVLYPMLAPNRRFERREDVLAQLAALGFQIGHVLDLSRYESDGMYLEGTGSLVLDRVNRIAYACRSPRTSEPVLREFAQRMSYRAVLFDARDAQGRPIYHTNVMLSIGRRFAAVCLESISARDAEIVEASLIETGHTTIALSASQVGEFAGNMLEVATAHGACVAMSSRAKRALTADQAALLANLSGPIVTADIPTIEHYGGGSVRCMLAEIHLPRLANPVI